MSTTQELKNAIERSKKIEIMREKKEYQSRKMEIEELDLDCFRTIYQIIGQIFNDKRDELIATKKKYEELQNCYTQVVEKLNKTINIINANPNAYPALKTNQHPDLAVQQYQQQITKISLRNKEMIQIIKKNKEEFMNKVRELHLIYFQAIETQEVVWHPIQKRKRIESLSDPFKVNSREFYKERVYCLKERCDETYRNLLQLHEDSKLQSKYSQPPPSRAALAVNKENVTMSLKVSPLKSSSEITSIPNITPSCVKTNLYKEDKVKEPQTSIWGYIPVPKGNSGEAVEVITKSYHFKVGDQSTSVLLHPYGPWSIYMKDAEMYLGYDSILGNVILSICEIKKGAPYPPECLDSKDGVLCTLKTKKGEYRSMFDKFLVMKEGKYNTQFISSLLEASASNVKYKLMDPSGKAPLMWRYDEINAPTCFEVGVRYINTDSICNIVDDCKYPNSFDKFLSCFSSAMKVTEESSLQQITSQLSCTNYYFYCQNDWCEIAYYVSPLMGKEDRTMALENAIVTLLFVEGNQPLQLDSLSTNDIVIVVTHDINGYLVRVAQKGNDCFVETPLPQPNYVIPGYQMKGFMTTLIVDCYKCYRNRTQAMRHFTEKRDEVLTKIKKSK
ncbi:hypothetical protein EHI8A_008960 [Entamoeba histolytica HM-1:IMSS-B]|uniref:Uncharacterized protein n=6 Tax=Entamoeba histolytica TaxID=5759 RepID=C4LXJ6_ENTH1|nr:hypothetical protein EHI_073310 [Entamoeba histolytica HM-1:IMSS]EMD44720.1 Hypothetical protein EHI5A_009340 [Entamoeba histolytica KU27]EMH74169.1 hypothetical protein EHI8A_008960 [Entamoeba histolytica HM-1:IMSS-B]EMS12482.1 hypothetical protein KM1_006770 [Entamoeba histolytica HM-3:IMSS]ENY63936.1 hypothetical protein EHI7A_011790 [Entamoeba histolytica HM-1:IMSS-A]GAT93478.1 hypothetical protein CL6EHI_073310 [Entamoeba histolytica]|eukprot:XP_656693.1 hypothetical protein EHI_073310 [Entamoeba histolytica HM-1:IMSS]